MKYHIVSVYGYKVASFENESDRDICLEALEDYYPDCIFLTQTDD